MTVIASKDMELPLDDSQFAAISQFMKEFIAENSAALEDGVRIQVRVCYKNKRDIKTHGGNLGARVLALLVRLHDVPQWCNAYYTFNFKENKHYVTTDMIKRKVHLTYQEQIALYKLLVVRCCKRDIEYWPQVRNGLLGKLGKDLDTRLEA